MSDLIICGKKKLFGSVQIENSKNAILPILAACVMSSGKVTITDVPDFSDITNMLEIIKKLGAKVCSNGTDIFVDSSTICSTEIDGELSKKLRASIFLMGPLLARFKKCSASLPGGCNIGARPIDIHLQVFKELGINISQTADKVSCDAKYFFGGVAHLRMPSVGATENIIMCACLKENRITKIVGAAREPEIVDLCNFLCQMGAKIFGAGTSVITIYGVKKLNGTKYKPIPDRIVAGTYMIALAMCGGKIKLSNAKIEDNKRLVANLSNLGCTIYNDSANIYMSSKELVPQNISIITDVFPGYATDLQSQMLALLANIEGTHTIVEQLFESRFATAKELIKMGADIDVCGQRATIFGKKDCYIGSQVVCSDLRGGAALVLAGLAAKGTTIIQESQIIERGYEGFANKLTLLGADIHKDK